MLIRPITDQDRFVYNTVVHHPQQSWEWGEFKKMMGNEVERIGFFDNGKLEKALQVTFHKLPKINRTVGYFPKGYMPDEDQLSALKAIAREHKALFIKLEPNISQKVGTPSGHNSIVQFLQKNGCVPGKPLFTKHTFMIDLTKTEEQLFEQLSSKTRYNTNLAIKKGVQIYENSTVEGMEQYLKILKETTKRQGFYAHTPDYFRKMWQVMGASGLMRIFLAVYNNQVLTAWVVFVFNKTLYYPYGASLREHRDAMANNLMMWEMIKLGKQLDCTKFDLWGSLGENPNKQDPWYGFHHFKEGYGGDLHQFVGTYDLITDFALYHPFRLAENLRWKWLRLRTKLPF